MLKITVLFTVAILTDILVTHANTAPMPGLDIQNLLQSLQKQLQQDQRFQQRNPSLDNEENEESRFGSLKKEDFDSVVPLETSDNRYRNSKDVSRNTARVERLARQVLEQVLRDKTRQNKAESRPKKQIEINNLLYYNKDDNNNYDYENQDSDSSESDEDKEDFNIGSLSDYSKVYVVLNSDAIKKSKNVNLLNNLLSSLLSAPPSKNRGVKIQNRYKGFAMDDGVRRNNRESGEREYNMKGDDDRPRRPSSYGGHGGHGGRGSGGGGGGNGGGGGTAIPYIKEHGDIYEKDD